MKKLFLLASLPVLIGFGSLNAQTHEQGTVLLDGYYGFPNVFSILFKAVSSETDYESVTTKSLGPVGFRGEYLISEKFGAGLSFVYASSELSYREKTSGNPLGYYTTSLHIPRLRIMATWNLHLSKSEKVDTYIGGGIGYTTLKANLVTNDPGFDLDEYRAGGSFPLALRLFEVGQRIFIIDNLGLHWQIGFGAGPLFALGLSGRI